MKHLRRMFHRFVRLFTNAEAEADLAREVTAHLTLLEDDYVQQGMAPRRGPARRQARLRQYGTHQTTAFATSAPIKGWLRRFKTSATRCDNCAILPRLPQLLS